MKHAYLILAHTEFEVLKLLVSCLDDPRNDIYIHFDKKVKAIPDINTQSAGLTVLNHRVNVHWGGFSMMEAEFALFQTAIARGPYQYYHLLSGVDLPIKSQDYIHTFFNQNDGEEFIGFAWIHMPQEFARKVQFWHLFPEDFKSHSYFKRTLRAGFLFIQESLGIKRNQSIDFKKGSQWVSITDAMARYFLDHRVWIRKTFRNTFCCDELVMQTLCWASPFRERLHNIQSDSDGCMRTISWRSVPNAEEWTLRDWAKDDLAWLIDSPALFARKFNSKDRAFLQKICEIAARDEV